jgi:hypothetical protein
MLRKPPFPRSTWRARISHPRPAIPCWFGIACGLAFLAAAPGRPPRVGQTRPAAGSQASVNARRGPAARSDPGLFEVRLADGRRIELRLLIRKVEVTTRYGKLSVPVADVRRIDVGLRYPRGVRRRIRAAVVRLGDASFRVREAAGRELLRLDELAYPALQRAARSEDPEVRRRASQLARKLEERFKGEPLRVAEEDVLVTALFPVIGRIEGVALKGRSPALGEVRLHLADTRQVRSLGTERLLLERVRAAVGAGRTARTNQQGCGRKPYEETPRGGALLIGFEVTYGRFGANPTVKTIRPIFRTAAGRVVGKTHGVPGQGVIRVEAKPGYAVGAVTIKAGLGVDGMSVTFMEVGERGLDPQRAYESDWLGGLGGGPPTKLAGSGAPVVGIFGRTADGPQSTFNGLGLITAAVDE